MRYLILLCALCVSAVNLCAQTRTSVRDTLYNADGSRAAGQIEITWNAFLSADGKTIAAGKITRRITDGMLDLGLVPNAGATPAGTSYAITYLLASGLSYSETWVVPQSGTPVSLAAVRASVAPAPSVQVGQQQLSEGGGLQVLLDFYRAASATATRAGQCYWNITANALYCSTGAGAWQSYLSSTDPRLSDARTPVAHAASHGTGQSDAVTIAPAQVNGTAVIASDSRLSDARTPTAHAASHGAGASDALTVTPSQVAVHAVANPSAPTVTPQTAGGGKTWGYQIVAKTASSCGALGSTTGPSAEGTTTDGALNLTAPASGNVLAWLSVTGATGGYCIYRSSVPGGGTPSTLGLIAPVPAGVLTYTDSGAAGDGTYPFFINTAASFSGTNLAQVPTLVAVSNDASGAPWPNSGAIYGIANSTGGGFGPVGTGGYGLNRGNVWNVFGMDAEAYSFSGTVGNIVGALYTWAEIDSGSAAYLMGISVDSNYNAGATVAENYGIRIEDQTAGTKNFGIYTNETAGADNYAYYGAGTAKSYFGGQVDIHGTNLGQVPAVSITSTDSTGAGWPPSTGLLASADSTGGGQGAVGVSGWAYNHSNVHNVFGMDAGAYSFSGTVGNIVGGLYTYAEIDSGSAAYLMGISVDSNYNAGATVAENYGIRIENQTAGTKNWALWTGTGIVAFGDKVGIGTTGPSEKLDVKDGHIATSQTVVPTLSACGGGTPAMETGSTDQTGFFTAGTGALTSCTMTFNKAFARRPACAVYADNALALAGLQWTTTTTTLVVQATSLTSTKIGYLCF